MLAMSVLICLSALFSGSEAAFFSLPHRGRSRLRRSGPAGRLAASLLEDSDRLLSAILFWNLLINISYFAVASIVGKKLQESEAAGASAAITFTIGSLLVIIFFSEMLPKSIAVLSPYRLCLFVSPPLAIAIKIVGPLLPLVKGTNLAVGRLLWPSFEPEPEIDLADIERAIELGTDDAALLQRERLVLRGLVALSETRVGEWMRPRSRLQLVRDAEVQNVVLTEPPPSGYLMIADTQGEAITATVPIRSLRPTQLDDWASAMEPVVYVPWSSRVAQVLDQLNEEDRSVAVVVNEFGEVLGAVTIDDIMRRVLSRRDDHDPSIEGEASVQTIGIDHYRVFGTYSAPKLG